MSETQTSAPARETDPRHTFYSDAQVEARWGRGAGYMSDLRTQGNGPKFTRLSPRVVRYRGDHLLEYEEKRAFSSNAEALAAAYDDPSPESA